MTTELEFIDYCIEEYQRDIKREAAGCFGICELFMFKLIDPPDPYISLKDYYPELYNFLLSKKELGNDREYFWETILPEGALKRIEILTEYKNIHYQQSKK